MKRSKTRKKSNTAVLLLIAAAFILGGFLGYQTGVSAAGSEVSHNVRQLRSGTFGADLSETGNFVFPGGVGVGGAAPSASGKLTVSSAPDPWPLFLQSSSGYIQIGAGNPSYAHFYTDRPQYYFNKPIFVDSGMVSSYGTDLFLQDAGTTVVTIDAGGEVQINRKLNVAGDIAAYALYLKREPPFPGFIQFQPGEIPDFHCDSVSRGKVYFDDSVNRLCFCDGVRFRKINAPAENCNP